MSQAVTSQKHLSQSNSYRDFLIKYCYLGSTTTSATLRNTLIVLLVEASDAIIDSVYTFMSLYIMPYFQSDRQLFNKIRECFMKQVLIELILGSTGTDAYNSFVSNYNKWMVQSDARGSKVWLTVCTELMQRMQDEYRKLYHN